MSQKNLALFSSSAGVEAREIPVPSPGPRELVVAVQAVSVNPVDVKRKAATPPAEAKVLGFDASGTVVAVGSEVELFAVGDEVFYAGSIAKPGSNQRFQAVDERIVGRKPATLGWADAASLPLTALTAYEAAFDRLGLTAASEGVFLVVGASGGVGSVLVQLLRELAPKVTIVGTASTEQGRDWVLSHGAHAVVNHRDDLEGGMLAAAPEGVDWIFTAHSKDQAEVYARLLKPFGHVVAIDDGPRDISPLKAKSIAWHWELMFTTPTQLPASTRQHEILEHIAELADAGRLVATATEVIEPLAASSLQRAHEQVESGRTVGKVVVAGWE